MANSIGITRMSILRTSAASSTSNGKTGPSSSLGRLESAIRSTLLCSTGDQRSMDRIRSRSRSRVHTWNNTHSCDVAKMRRRLVAVDKRIKGKRSSSQVSQAPDTCAAQTARSRADGSRLNLYFCVCSPQAKAENNASAVLSVRHERG